MICLCNNLFNLIHYILLNYVLRLESSLLLLGRSRRSWVDDSFVGQRVGVDCNSGDFWRLQWRRLLAPRLRPFSPNRKPFPFIQRIKAIQNLAKNCVHIIQVRLLLVQDEKLRLEKENQEFCEPIEAKTKCKIEVHVTSGKVFNSHRSADYCTFECCYVANAVHTLLVFGPLFAIESLPRRSCLLFG